MKRRAFLHGVGVLAAAGMLPPAAFAAPARGRVVVVGGGFAGATAARHLRLWAPNVEVTLVEPNRQFISCPMSNRVLAGALALRDLSRSYDGLAAQGVRVLHDTVTGIDPARRTVGTAGNGTLGYERLVLAPGVDFVYDGIAGMESPKAREHILHAWKAGPQTVALRNQLTAMRQGGVFALTVPKAPYRCPPGPYERACMAAYYLKKANPRAKVLLFDANPDVQSKKELFLSVWKNNYAGMVEYVPNAEIRRVDAAAMILKFELQGDAKADVINLIPPQSAGSIARRSGTADADGRWCGVDFLTYESRAVPNVHVIGDAVLASPGMPKSGHMANQQAKVCAAAVAALLAGEPVNDEPILSNTCYSFVADMEVMHVASIYRYDKAQRTMLPVPKAGGVSRAPSAEEGYMAVAWVFNILNDMFG